MCWFDVTWPLPPVTLPITEPVTPIVPPPGHGISKLRGRVASVADGMNAALLLRLRAPATTLASVWDNEVVGAGAGDVTYAGAPPHALIATAAPMATPREVGRTVPHSRSDPRREIPSVPIDPRC